MNIQEQIRQLHTLLYNSEVVNLADVVRLTALKRSLTQPIEYDDLVNNNVIRSFMD